MAHAGGRPTKYDRAFCQEVEKYMAKGKSERQTAKHLGIALATFQLWMEEHEEFSVSVKKGLAESAAYWEELIDLAAIGAPIKVKVDDEITTGKKGSKKEVTLTPNPTLLIFTLKNKAGWRDKKEVTADVNIDIPNSGKERLERIFSETRKKSEKIRPKIVKKPSGRKKVADEG
jgi:hypothetical protein